MRDDVRERREKLLGNAVDPLKIFDGENKRDLAAPPDPQMPQRLEHARLDHVGLEPRQPLRPRLEAQQMKEIRTAPGRIEPELLQGDVDARGDFRLVGVHDPAARLEGLQHRQVWSGRAVGEALRLDVTDVFADQTLVELVQQTGLADTGLARDPDDLTMAPHCRLEPAPEDLDLPVAADERRPVPAEPGRRATGEGEHAADRAAVDVEELETALEKARGDFADEDRSGITPLDECRQYLDHFLPGPDVELRCAQPEPDQALLEMDPHRHRWRPGIFLASSRDCLLDRQSGMGGQAWRVLRPVETERGQDAARADPFEVPAEAHDFLDQNLERAVCREQRVRLDR